MWRPPQMLMNLTAAGFELFWLSDAFTRTDAESRSIADPLQTLQTITPQNLAYDLWDAHAYRCDVVYRISLRVCMRALFTPLLRIPSSRPLVPSAHI